MKYVNKQGAPAAWFRAVANDPYNRGKTYSPSLLNAPARATALIEKHGDEIEVDVSSRVAATIGQGAHVILERGAREGIDIVEVRFEREIEVDGQKYMVSAQLDLFEKDTGDLQDWKTAKTYAFHKKSGAGKKDEWCSQLNVGRWVLAGNKELPPVKRLVIVGLLKDWDQRKAQSEPGYPPTEIMAVEQKMWTLDETEAWIAGRIRAIVSARKELPLCTTKETWGGNRCGRWCEASSVCEQYQETLKTGLLKKVESW